MACCGSSKNPNTPPRSRRRSAGPSFKSRSTLDTLEHMGFPRAKAEKAIAATGNHGVQTASEWLLAHVNDAEIDNYEPRDYILYLCPRGQLSDELSQFWKTTQQVCGWNSAHMYQPHITLSSFFKIPNNLVGIIDEAMQCASKTMDRWPKQGPMTLDLVTQNKNFIGFFITSKYQQMIEELTAVLQEAFQAAGIDMKPQKKQLHMTLGFQYEPAHHDLLMKLSQEIDVTCDSGWELCALSRDALCKGSEARKVIKDYEPAQEDELPLCLGDYVYMEPEEHDRSPDGWFKGTSLQSGATGFFPGNFTIKTSQMDIWTWHRKVQLPFTSKSDPFDAIGQSQDVTTSKTEDLYAKVNKPKNQRKIYVMRHGERCDFAFSTKWFENSFDSAGQYSRFNTNCPRSVLPRKNFKDYSKDSPLTEIGKAQARITGEALKDVGVTISFIFSSPSLRCIETASEVLKGLESNCKINIEPSLFEWGGFHKPALPSFISATDFAGFGYPVETTYNPHLVSSNIQVYETIEEYYSRSASFSKYITRKLKPLGGNILFIGHSATLDASTRQLRERSVCSYEEFRNIVRGCPYCFLGNVKEGSDHGPWTLEEPPIKPLNHQHNNKEYNWQSIMS